MNARDKAFYSGIRTALCLLDLHDQDTIYDELVKQCNVEELVASAVDDGELEWSGLAKRGYAQQSMHADQKRAGLSTEDAKPIAFCDECQNYHEA